MSPLADIPAHIADLIGVAGFCLYVMNYAALTFHWLDSHCRLYFAVNLVAATCVLIGLSSSFNLAAALIQLFWVVMATVGLCVRCRRNARKAS